jgi:hypothetical protein
MTTPAPQTERIQKPLPAHQQSQVAGNYSIQIVSHMQNNCKSRELRLLLQDERSVAEK